MKINQVTDKIIWENFIARYSPQSLFQSWHWGLSVAAGNKSKVLRLGLYEGSRLVAVMQNISVFAKRGSFLHIRHGPLLSDWNNKYFDYLLDYCKNYCRKHKLSFIRVSPLIENSEKNINFFKRQGFRSAPLHRM